MRKVLLALCCIIFFHPGIMAQRRDTITNIYFTNNVSDTSNRSIISYDVSCRIATNIGQSYNSAGATKWQTRNKITYTYNSTDDSIIALAQYLDTNSSRWVNDYRQITFYTNNRLTENYLSQSWDTITKNWLNVYQAITELNTSYNPISITSLIYHNNAWENSSKIEYEYNADQLIISQTNSDWIDSAWVYRFKATTTYLNNYTSSRSFYYDWGYTNSWVLSMRILNTLAPVTANVLESTQQVLSNNIWTNQYHLKIVYSKNLPATFYSQYWNNYSQVWVNSLKQDFKYYANTSMRSGEFSDWSQTDNIWKPWARVEYTKSTCQLNLVNSIAKASLFTRENKHDDTNASQIKLITRVRSVKNGVYQEKYVIALPVKNATEPIYITTGSQTENIIDTATIATSKNEKTLITIFPNPAHNYLILKTNKQLTKNAFLKISDITGKTVLQKNIAGGVEQRIEITNLQKGAYIVTLISGKETQNQKLLVQ